MSSIIPHSIPRKANLTSISIPAWIRTLRTVSGVPILKMHAEMHLQEESPHESLRFGVAFNRSSAGSLETLEYYW